MRHIAGLCLGLLMFVSCEKVFMENQKANTPQNNFDLLWQIFDERYCFFEEKGIDWDDTYTEYAAMLRDYSGNIPSESLFHLMATMLDELQDGHVTISNHIETRNHNQWYSAYPENYDESLANTYLNRRAIFVGDNLIFCSLPENIGYIRCTSFTDKFNRTALDKAMANFTGHKGVIVDVRNNGGGLVSEAYTLAARFTRQKTRVGYIRYKTGKGHNDFSDYFNRYSEPEGRQFTGKVAILTNRKVYSAANLFVSIMKSLPNTRIIGDHTGGGGGIPISAELYNGWTIELSTNQVFDAGKMNIEAGIEPHEKVSLQTEQKKDENPVDQIIESAKKWILANK